MRILVLCTGNSCRSQMMEGYLRQMLPQGAEVLSAGIEAHGLNPRAVSAMAADGLDISSHTSNLLQDYLQLEMDHVITVCDHAAGLCPVFPGPGQRWHHSFPDPAKAEGTEAEISQEFARVRDEIRSWAQDWVKHLG